jgi:hypothetical protein
MSLSDEKIAEIRRISEIQQNTMVEAARSMVAVWKSQLDMALVTDDEEVVRQIVGRTPKPAYWDTNPGCVINNCVSPPKIM